MTSVNTNASATTALRTLQATNKALESTQTRISTGLKIGEAKDNAAYWAISTTLKSDNKSLSTVKDALGLGAATVDVAYQGLNKAKEVLDEIKSKLTAASAAGVNKDTIQQEIAELQNQLKSIAGSSVFSGENWLSINSSVPGYDSTKSVVASFSRDASNSVSIGTIEVDASAVALFDSNATSATRGIVDSKVSLKDAKGNDLSFGGLAMDGNKDAGGLSAVKSAGTDAVKAKSAFTGAFVGTTLDADDELTLSFKADNATNATTIKIKVGDVAGSGVAKAGTIGSVDELAFVVNNVLKANGITNVAAIKDGNGFALQRTEGGLNHTVEVTEFSGTDSPFTNSVVSAGAVGSAATAYTPVQQTFTIAGPASADGTLRLALATGEAITLNVDFTGGMDTATEIADALEALIEGDATLNALIGIDNTAGAVTLTYKTAGEKGLATVTPAATGVTLGVAVAQSVPYASNAATVASGISGSSSAVFKDADDKILFKFQDSLVGGGTTQTIEITKADLETAGVTDLDIDNGTDLQLALAAAFTRQAASNSIFANYTVSSTGTGNITLTRKGPGVAGQTLTIVAGLTALDPSPAVTNTLGLTRATGVKQGANATEASAASTLSLPAGGIALDADDNISFDVAVGTSASRSVKIDAALVNSTLATSTKAKAVMGTFDVAGLKNADVVSFSVDWNGTASTYTITGLSETSSINDVVTKINAATTIAGASGAFNTKGLASIENGKIVFSALTAGSANSVKVYDVSNTNAYAGEAGLQASGVIFGENAMASANGTISTAAQYARIVNAALGTAGIAGVQASVSGGGIALASTNTGTSATVETSNVIASAGANQISLDKIDISSAGLAASGATSADQVRTVLSAYIGLVNTAITKVTEAASNLGSVAKRIDLQNTFVDTLMDTIDKGVGNLIDADLSEESTRLQALQTKQQLGVQALSIANSGTQQILRLFQ